MLPTVSLAGSPPPGLLPVQGEQAGTTCQNPRPAPSSVSRQFPPRVESRGAKCVLCTPGAGGQLRGWPSAASVWAAASRSVQRGTQETGSVALGSLHEVVGWQVCGQWLGEHGSSPHRRGTAMATRSPGLRSQDGGSAPTWLPAWLTRPEGQKGGSLGSGAWRPSEGSEPQGGCRWEPGHPVQPEF